MRRRSGRTGRIWASRPSTPGQRSVNRLRKLESVPELRGYGARAVPTLAILRPPSFLESIPEHPAEPEGVVCPVALWHRRRRGLVELPDLTDTTAQPKQRGRPGCG